MATTTSPQTPRSIIITGGGIIGCTTAYFLTRHPQYNPSLHNIILLEASAIAGGASGKAGGLLALWAYPSSLVPLSYRLHAELAREHGGEKKWGYRRIHCGQLEARGRPLDGRKTGAGKGKENGEREKEKEDVSLQKRTKEAVGMLRAKGMPKGLDWFAPESVRAYEEMGDPDTTAQVHPFQFTTSMAELAREKGVDIRLGAQVTDIEIESEKVRSVSYRDKKTGKEEKVEASDVVLSAGPWTKEVYSKAPISALRAHSVTVKPSRPVSAYALFTEITLPTDFGSKNESVKSRRGKGTKQVTPEIYARPNNEVYACGEGDRFIPLPKTSDLVQVDEERCQDIVDYISSISDEMKDGEVTARQACYLPEVSGSARGPLVGETGVKGLFMAAGHSCWGIQNGAGTGKLISEFIFDGKAKSANIGGLDPRKAM
ncbi:MAG: hypothetical protein M1812_007048 [Candelaria pacifica]|nr:MAG: hypothetical protein M1812_007048 [Candelaria pacifica]